MKPYDSKARCPKCFENDARVYYIDSTDTLKRVCGLCGFVWHELPLDRKPGDDGPRLVPVYENAKVVLRPAYNPNETH